ncbi:uncharacterized protein DUF4838 [Sphingobacterium allocomposti]|uniref:Uncharacterized protein DUF4838 n=1 Tax=Sphingobacterium allocomposti TaxID=415956 RepID=A0A5S5CVL4_9SPHI|nr:DUF4838 domain-containing protein [Sphingobacterium composti Yoo et al. 2007 non Ten et al. 2007]TYP87827.1 uncharacterized protein DUF4838 [Sphingobacterium composti Yoo et al. 2007 non Ten et al. 2007]
MYPFKLLLVLWLFPALCCCRGEASPFDFSLRQLLIISNGDRESSAAADYLYQHLDKRNKDRSVLIVYRSDQQRPDFDGATVYMEVVADLVCDYQIINEERKLSIYGKNKGILKWLSYMLIDRLGAYHPLDVSDLPPGYVDFQSVEATVAMGYREPHLLPNTDEDYSGLLFTHSVDRDWGLWGHNLAKVFVNGTPERSLALVDGKRTSEQYCFSSEETFKAVRSFVTDNYGSGERGAAWFMIAPDDNDLVCTCSSCRTQGNTPKSATGAVVTLVNRLAKQFPAHRFVTTAYRTTKAPSTVALADNAGVFISTIDFPKTADVDRSDPAVKEFAGVVSRWRQKTGHVYLWDYISNFDDYLTPYPVLLRVQKQLEYFRSLGIDGMFLNGSGYDYTTFDDVKTYVLSALLIDPSLSVNELVRKYHARFYPVTGALLTAYLLDMEEQCHLQEVDAGIYSSFRAGMLTYFNHKKFLAFYDGLMRLLPKLEGGERKRIDRLLTALSYTRLQIAYHRGGGKDGLLEDPDQRRLARHNNEALARLRSFGSFSGLERYKEEEGWLATYLQEWETLREKPLFANSIRKTMVRGLSSGDVLPEGYLLSDCVGGFPSDFNQGWLLAAENIQVTCTTEDLRSAPVQLEIRFLINARHRMLPPDRVEIIVNGRSVLSYSEADFERIGNLAVLQKKLGSPLAPTMEIRIYKNKELDKSVIACDEIRLY